ncbi:MAG TPA: hypothetical protein DIU00_17265 [Phycisphaerales bacterium]|nr:hypothetical protein [Phycisphaerales bacterium]
MLRVWLILLAFPALVIAAAAAEEDEDPFNVDFFCGWGGYYRPMEWTPVEIGISSTLTEPFAGLITVSAQQDGLNTMNVNYEFVLTPDIPLHLPLVTKFAFTADKCSVRLVDKERGRTQWSQDYELWGMETGSRFITVVNENDMLIGLVGNRKFGLLRLPKQSKCLSNRGQGEVQVGDKLPRMVPWDWTGFVPLDLLILYDPDWNLFNTQQLKAITQWISNGGKLLLVPGSHPLAAANPIARLLPVELHDLKQTTVPAEILEKMGLTGGEPEQVTAWSLVPKSEANFYKVETNDAGDCLFATGYAGFGHVGVLAFDPATMTDRQRENSASFWIYCIRDVLEYGNSLSFGTTTGAIRSNQVSRTIQSASDAKNEKGRPGNRNRFEIGRAQAVNNAVMEFLYQGIRPLSIWWVILLLITLAVLLGPVDYKLLKRFDRLPLTWLTCAFWIILFTVGAYYGVQALRAGDMELRVVSVLDGIDNSEHAWSTSYCGVFAPYSDDYRLERLQVNQWWSGIAPAQQSIWQQSKEIAGRRIYCFQHDGGNLPYSIPINIWDVQCLLNESALEKMPFDAEVQRQGDQIVVNVVNESESPISKGRVLLSNNRGIVFGNVPAGTSKQFSIRSHRMGIWDDYGEERYRQYYSRRGRSYNMNFKKEDAFFAQGCLQRTQAMSAYLASGAAVVSVEYDRAPVSFALKDHTYKRNHIQLARLVVFPKEQEEETQK